MDIIHPKHTLKNVSQVFRRGNVKSDKDVQRKLNININYIVNVESFVLYIFSGNR